MLRNEVGCVHTSQGLEFDWVGVFIGKDLRYDPDKKMLFADIDNYWGGARNLEPEGSSIIGSPSGNPE